MTVLETVLVVVLVCYGVGVVYQSDNGPDYDE